MSHYSPIFGLYYVLKGVYVPVDLLNVHASAQIKDLSAQVILSQRYHLPESAHGALEASYSFPIPARAAVSSFALVKQDGSRVVGVVQEKEEARATYDVAVESGKLASLMVQDSPEVFTVSVGNILPGETVTVELSYATELTEDEDNDSVRFTLPVHIGARYGASPVEHASSSVQATTNSFFTFDAAIESVAPIAKIGCPSHTIETSLGPDPSLPNAAFLPFSNYARVAFSSNKDLATNLVLTLKSAGLDSPRCAAEVHPTAGTAAVALTLVPRFQLPDLAKQEFIFLVDRSGSMEGSRIETAKKALVVMLRSLPVGSSFNIFSFGDGASAWSKGSSPYNQKTLVDATKHVDGMEADFGGTEIRAALEAVFKSRKTDLPTSVFVLTDGDAWELDAVITSVKSAVAASPAGAYLRIFALGIGNSSSTAMVEGMARVGNGVSAFVTDGESFTGKAARLLKAARSPLVTNIRIDWAYIVNSKEVGSDEDFEILSDGDSEHTVAQPDVAKPPISLFDVDMDPFASLNTPPPPPPPFVLPPPAPIQQSPYTIRNLSPANRLYVYSILSARAFTSPASLPQFATLRGELSSGEKVELSVPVTASQLPGSTALHVLAARKIIQDLEDGQHGFLEENGDVKALVKASIVRLGKTYSIASTHTSFVAVDESEQDGARKANVQSTRTIEEEPFYGVEKCKKKAKLVNPSHFGFDQQLYGGGEVRARQSCVRRYRQASPDVDVDLNFRYRQAPPDLGLYRGEEDEEEAEDESEQDAPVAARIPIPASLSPSDRLDALVRLQAFDGSFDPAVTDFCGVSLAAVVLLGANEVLAATLVAMRYLEERVRGAREAWEAVWEKAKEFCVSALGGEEEFEKVWEGTRGLVFA